MNLLDMIIIATMLVLIFRGLFRGFFKEIGSLAGVILGIWLGNLFQPQMTEHLRIYLPASRYLPLLAFGMVFAIILFVCNLAGWFLSALSKKAFLGWVDKALGAGLAVLKGVILIYLGIVLLTFFVPAKTPLIAKSGLAPLIITSYQSMVALVSPKSYQRWKERLLEEGRRMGRKGLEKRPHEQPRTYGS